MRSHISKSHNIKSCRYVVVYTLAKRKLRENLIMVFSRPRNMKEEGIIRMWPEKY